MMRPHGPECLWFAAGGALALVWGGYTLRQARLSESWPAVEGVVVQSRMAYATSRDSNTPDAQRERELDLKYRYEVDGVTYDSRVVSWSDDSPLALLWPLVHNEELVAKYPVGARILVHYDPVDPARAVLEKGGGTQSTLILLGGLLAIGYAAWESRRAGRG